MHHAIKCLYSQHVIWSIPSYCGGGEEERGLESKSNLHSHTYRGHSQATNCTMCHYSLPLLQRGAPLQRWSRSRKKMWAEFFRRRRGRSKSKQMDEGSTEGVGGLTAASDLREAITPRTLASDCGVFDDASPLISEKERRQVHGNPKSWCMHVCSAFLLSLGWLLPHLLQMQQWPSFCGGIIKVSCESIVQGIKR